MVNQSQKSKKIELLFTKFLECIVDPGNNQLAASNQIVHCPHIIRCLCSHHVVLSFTNVNENTPLTQFYGFCKVIVAKKACPVIFRFDVFRTCTEDPNSTAFSDVKCYSLSLCIITYQ